MAVDCKTEVAGGFRQIVQVDAHTLHADVKPAQGGQDSAPGAHEYFDVSLATCKALTATWYAKKNGIPLDRVEAHVERDDSREREGDHPRGETAGDRGDAPHEDPQSQEPSPLAAVCERPEDGARDEVADEENGAEQASHAVAQRKVALDRRENGG